MDLFTLWKGGKIVNQMLGDKCPYCGNKSWATQEYVGKTWFTGKIKIRCGECGKVFKVKKK